MMDRPPENELRLSERQRRILEALARISPDLSRTYLGALRVFNDGQNPDRHSLTAHSIRELANLLPRYLDVTLPRRFEPTADLDRILPLWQESRQDPSGSKESRTEGSDREPPERIPISAQLYRELDGFFERFDSSRTFNRRGITKRMLEATDPANSSSSGNVLDPSIQQWLDVEEWFVGVVHHGPHSQSEFERKFQVFESALFAIVCPFYLPVEELDSLLQVEKPEREHIDKLVALTKKREQYAYFFDRLQHPGWLMPLWERGYFKSAPEPVEAAGGTRLPRWPELVYLKRVAAILPKEVLEIIIRMQETSNSRVHSELVDVALIMPAPHAAKVAKLAKLWNRSHLSLLLLPQKLGILMGKLATEREPEAAFSLADSILEVEQDVAHSEFPVAPSNRSPQLDSWDYERILNEDFPSLFKADKLRAVKLLCFKLGHATRQDSSGSTTVNEDSSYTWRPAIEPHEQNPKIPSIRDTLVTHIRDLSEALLRDEPGQVREFIDFLRSLRFPIFTRIELHLLRVVEGIAVDTVAECLGNRNLFENHRIRHEYDLLLAKYFSSVPVNVRNEILGWVDEGPKRVRGIPSSEIEEYKRQWQLDRLFPIRDSLPPIWQERYTELEKHFGRPEEGSFPFRLTSWVGPTSPVTEDELKSMGPEELFTFLKTWVPPKDHFAPSPEGLAEMLSKAIAEKPEKFPEIASRFKDHGMKLAYTWALLSGLTKALKNDSPIDWASVLDLCQWIAQHFNQAGRKTENRDGDFGWDSLGKSVADLLREGLSSLNNGIPFSARDIVWAILVRLTSESHRDDQDASLETALDPLTASLNNVKGMATHAVFQYARWCSKNQASQPPLSGMPEVKEVLEHALEESNASSTMHAVFGCHLPTLVYLDSQWARGLLSRVFPTEPRLSRLWAAAWTAYVQCCAPHSQIVQLIQTEYERAIERLESTQTNGELDEPSNRTAEHLMVLYLRGYYPLGSGSIIYRFFDKAPGRIRGHAISFIGHLFKDRTDAPPEVLGRLEVLWKYRLNKAKENSRPDQHEELSQFGWWFGNIPLAESLALSLLMESLEANDGQIEPDHLVAERLGDLAQRFPRETLLCLRKMAQGDKEGWEIGYSQEHIFRVLRPAFLNEDEEVRSLAEETVHYLGSRGFHDFRRLLRIEEEIPGP